MNLLERFSMIIMIIVIWIPLAYKKLMQANGLTEYKFKEIYLRKFTNKKNKVQTIFDIRMYLRYKLSFAFLSEHEK